MGEVCQVVTIGFCIILICTGFSLLMVWLTAHRHRPEFYLTDFSISNASRHRLQKSGLANLPVRFAVNGHNPNKMVGIYCKEMTASVYYGDQLVASGPVMESSFYLAPKKADAPIQGALNATGPTPADPAWAWLADDLSEGILAMRLLLGTKLRFKWYPNKHQYLTVECVFRLGKDGGSLLDLQQQDKYSWCRGHVLY